MKYRQHRILFLSACTLIFSLFGAAGRLDAKDKTRAPITYPFSELRSLELLPVIDNTGDSSKIKPEKVRKELTKILSGRRYVVTHAGADAKLQGFSDEEFKTASEEVIRSLGPQGSRWIMVICVGDVGSKLTFGSVANAKVHGYLYDKERGKLAWHDSGFGTAAGGGVVGMLMKSTITSAAVILALHQKTEVFPKLPKIEKPE